MKTTERIFDAATGETTDIEREMSPSELKQFEQTKILLAEEQSKREELKLKRSAALAKLEALGLNENDLKALGF